MNKKWLLMLTLLIPILSSACIGVIKTYADSNTIDYESSSELGKLYVYISILKSEEYFFPRNYFQSVLPYSYENHEIEVSVSNWIYLRGEEDIMRYMYIDECRIVLPSGKNINLVEGDITIIYNYFVTEEVTGVPYKILRNVKPHYVDGKRVVYIDGFADGDSVSIRFNAKIPAYFTNNIRLEYTHTTVWENIGNVKQHGNILFKKKTHISNPFTV
jgi:hypothetical protein